MRQPASDVVFRIAAAAGLAVSLLLYSEYTGQSATLCGEGGGCDAVRASIYAHPFGVPMPVFGVAFFLSLGLAATLPRLRRALVPLALLGGLGALALLALQAFAIHAFCRFCLVADASALVAAGTAGGVSFAGARRRAFALSGGLTLAALALPALVIARAPAPPAALPGASAATAASLPAAVAREQRPGMLTIVEFTDFECPYCRQLHVALEEALRGLDGLGARVRIVRKMMPLPQLHPHALDAALAWCCADQAGRGDAMASALVHADDLDREANVKLAAGVGLDPAKFRACVASPSTRARVDADVSDADAAGVALRLPTYWIGSTMYRGVRDAATLRRCLETEAEGLAAR
jgi:uncharacterized membrane protein/predicted DsbA family dithiol-disulfide isomerase